MNVKKAKNKKAKNLKGGADAPASGSGSAPAPAPCPTGEVRGLTGKCARLPVTR